MPKHLIDKIGQMHYDNLVADITPPLHVGGVTIAALAAETTYPRGTLMGLDPSSGLSYIYGSADAPAGTVPAHVLCDNTLVGTDDTVASAYNMGNFNADALTVADGYDLTDADKDALRTRNIYLSAMLKASPAWSN